MHKPAASSLTEQRDLAGVDGAAVRVRCAVDGTGTTLVDSSRLGAPMTVVDGDCWDEALSWADGSESLPVNVNQTRTNAPTLAMAMPSSTIGTAFFEGDDGGDAFCSTGTAAGLGVALDGSGRGRDTCEGGVRGAGFGWPGARAGGVSSALMPLAFTPVWRPQYGQ